MDGARSPLSGHLRHHHHHHHHRHRHHTALTVPRLLIVVLCEITMTATLASSSSSSSSSLSALWKAAAPRIDASSVLTTTTTTSRGQCVLRCLQMMGEGCRSAGYDAASNVCHLQAVSHQHQLSAGGGEEDGGGEGGSPQSSLSVYALDSVSRCEVADAPPVPNAHVSSWRVTSSSLEGDVSCDEDYMFDVHDASLVRCQLDTGLWTTEMAGTCGQIVWRNDTVKTRPDGEYPLPRPVEVGWAVCLSATPTMEAEFAVDLDASDLDKPLHVVARLNSPQGYRTTVLNYVHNGQWGAGETQLADPSPPFPFQTGVSFNMTVRATSANMFSVYVNEEFYGTKAVPMPVSDVSKVTFSADIQVHSLNVWC